MTDLPSRPWSNLEVEVKMAQVIAKQDDAIADLKGYAEKYADARRTYEVKKNQSILVARQDTSLKTDAQRLAWATIQAADDRFAKDMAEGALMAQRDVVKTLMSQADTLRSLARSGRDLVEQPGFGGR